MAAPTCMELYAGCYERTTLGYVVNENAKFVIKAKFTDNSHIGYVKTLAASESFLATGSTDETIHLYNLVTNRELGTLLQHNGSITSICFHGDSHMISGSADGTIGIWHTASWELMKSLRAHKGGVNSVAIHPSGKLALTAGQDKSLRTWNLVKGRVAYTTNIKQVADFVSWSPDGELYIVVGDSIINVYTITTATITSSIDCQRKILAVSFVTNRILAVGGEGGNIQLFELSEGKSTCRCDFKAHENRVKGIQCTSDRSSQPEENCRWLVTVSSDSHLKIWSVNVETLDEPTLLADVNTTARLTCVGVRPVLSQSADSPVGKPGVPMTDKSRESLEEDSTLTKRKNTGAEQDSRKKKFKARKQRP
ncbi:p21-activated protein kinase-interacting protein 1-like isoform X2 [Acanthaster planci]|uniref:P21-activated protein kinase-interacting protein 1-like isoform X2 n=1 Tax=Acanthaster planci TaxID=133434 RepID=A0A8B7Y9V2_ACAPL|nr:p21-activated protein kinase-interacting protein 1-like isoform X2 [Acanthaster planci]